MATLSVGFEDDLLTFAERTVMRKKELASGGNLKNRAY
jgi:hypothetical protein